MPLKQHTFFKNYIRKKSLKISQYIIFNYFFFFFLLNRVYTVSHRLPIPKCCLYLSRASSISSLHSSILCRMPLFQDLCGFTFFLLSALTIIRDIPNSYHVTKPLQHSFFSFRRRFKIKKSTDNHSTMPRYKICLLYTSRCV